MNFSNTQITQGYHRLIWIIKGRASKTRTAVTPGHVVYTSRNGEEMNSWLSPLCLLSIFSPCCLRWPRWMAESLPGPTSIFSLPWAHAALNQHYFEVAKFSVTPTDLTLCLWKSYFSHPQWPTVSGSTVCPVFRETSLNPAPLTLLWLLCKVHVLWMKCVIFEPVSVVKNGIEEAVVASGSTVKWDQDYSVNFIRWNWYSLQTYYCPIS